MRTGRMTGPAARWLAAAFFSFAALAVIALPALSGPKAKPAPADAASRVHLDPKLVPGSVVRYQVQFQTTNRAKSSGAVSDPQGPSQTVVTWNALLRIEVLPAVQSSGGSAPPAPAAIRLRTTYEKSSATVDSDAPDPERDAVLKQYADMEGKSLEFTVASDGRISNVQGLEGIVSGSEALAAAQQWMARFSSGASAPSAGVAPGDKWDSEEPADSLPLAGYVWRTDSTYLRNEPCAAADGAAAAAEAAPGSATGGDMCAVILTQLLLLPPPRSQKDPTPDQYGRNGVSTSGTWEGSGEGMTYVSLRDGWVTSVVENMSQQMDVTMSSALNASVRYAGAVTTHSQMSLAPAAP